VDGKGILKIPSTLCAAVPLLRTCMDTIKIGLSALETAIDLDIGVMESCNYGWSYLLGVDWVGCLLKDELVDFQ
jgi:hypothetical protein